MERLEILPSQLREAAEVMQQAASGIDGELTTLASRLEALRSGWEGSAQTAFDQAQLRAVQDIERQRRILGAIAGAAGRLADLYGQTDRTAAHRLGGQGDTGLTTVKTLGVG